MMIAQRAQRGDLSGLKSDCRSREGLQLVFVRKRKSGGRNFGALWKEVGARICVLISGPEEDRDWR